MVSFWNEIDLVLTPTLALPPVPIGWQEQGVEGAVEQLLRNTEFTPFTAIANVTGLPAVSLPLHWTEDGLPVGVQAIGPPAGTRSSSVLPPKSRRHGLGAGVRPCPDRLAVAQRRGVIRTFCPGLACSIRAALPREIATDMFP